MGGTIIAIIITLCVVAPVTWLIAVAYRKKVYESKIGKAEEKSREIIDEALKVAETKKREALLEAKEESMKTKNDLEKEVRERRAEIQRYERRVLNKEENLEKRSEALEKNDPAIIRDVLHQIIPTFHEPEEVNRDLSRIVGKEQDVKLGTKVPV